MNVVIPSYISPSQMIICVLLRTEPTGTRLEGASCGLGVCDQFGRFDVNEIERNGGIFCVDGEEENVSLKKVRGTVAIRPLVRRGGRG